MMSPGDRTRMRISHIQEKKSSISQKSDTILIRELLWVEDWILHYTKRVLFIQKIGQIFIKLTLLITIPLMACYPILLYLGLSQRISTIITMLLSGAAYILLVTHIEPALRRTLPFTRPKARNLLMTKTIEKVQKAITTSARKDSNNSKNSFPNV